MSHLGFPIVNFSDLTVKSVPKEKMCPVGKSCGATCIHRNYACLLEMSPPISGALNRVSSSIATPSYPKANPEPKTTNVSAVVRAHPSLAKDVSEESLRNAFKSIELLDPDATRRVSALSKILSNTKTLFLDWKDQDANQNLFTSMFDRLFANPLATFQREVNKKTWSGLAFREGATLIRAFPGFEPNVKQIKATIDKQLSSIASGKELPYQVGKGTKAPGNNTLITLVHEMGHHADFRSNLASISMNLQTISKYGEVDNREPFAELFAAYIFSGPRLKKLFPSEYKAVESILQMSNLL